MFFPIPNVAAENRTTPKGKVLLNDGPLDADAPRAIPAVIRTGIITQTGNAMRLEAIPAGWAIAGSTMRWDNGSFRVSFDFDGALHGRRFAKLSDALALFDKWSA